MRSFLHRTEAMMVPLRPLLLLGLFLVPIVLGKDGKSGIPLKLTVDGISGNYTIQVGGADVSSATTLDGTFTTWLWSAETRLGDWNSADGTLVVSGVEKGTGSDVFGTYDVITLRWISHEESDDDQEFSWHTSFRTYKKDPSMIVLEQYFPNRFENKPFSERSNQLAAVSLFPSFQRRPPTTSALACFSYHEIFAQMKYCHLADYEETILGGSPLVMYNETDSTLPTLILSPLNWPMAQQMASSLTMFGAGVKANVTEIPAGWSQQFLLSASNGMSNAFLDWGDRMLMMKKVVEHGVAARETVDPRSPGQNNNHLRRPGPFPTHAKQQRPDNMYRDATHSTIGFWTDNGGYYHYNTGFENGTYEDVLPKVKAYHESLGIPFGHWQIDSWFYPKDGQTSRGGKGGAVLNWTALPDVFPTGVAGFQEKLGGMPLIMHNRQFSNHSDYILNWTDIEWYKGPMYAMPHDPEKFFRRFFTQQVGWGLAMYEQDWMKDQYFGVDALQTNITLADMWLRGMAIGADSQNVSIQYCMPYPNMILTASALSNVVTNARASGDYGPNKGQWEIGITSLFYWALGILPMKDGFYSSTLAQKGGYPEGPELRPDLQALISTLSCTMVAPMDGLNYINATRVKTACRSDGTILKPDVPVRTSDACFHRGPHADPSTHDPSTCLMYITHTDIQGIGRVRYVFRDETETLVTPAMAHIGDAGDVSDDFALYNWYTGELRLFGALNEVAPGYEGHSYSMIVPILPGGWIFLGEVDKYVPISRLRFSKVVSANADKLEVAASGVPGEQFRVCAAHTADLTRIHCHTETFESTTVQSLSFDRLLLDAQLANSPI